MTTHAYTPPPGLEAAMREGRCRMVWELVGDQIANMLNVLDSHPETIDVYISEKDAPYAVGDVLVWEELIWHDSRQPPTDAPIYEHYPFKITSVDCVRAADVTEAMARAMGYDPNPKPPVNAEGTYTYFMYSFPHTIDFDSAWVWIYKMEAADG